ncbi:hypothetical protein ACFSTJ_12355 [Ottowia pentelensis]|uniref:hypothetical protein n=1 Tax=Ottowia pentelensis TaxID=511108 RepID=UPI00362E13DF
MNVECDGKTFEGLEAQEVFKKLRTSKSMLFHNSPQSELARLRFREGFGTLREVSGNSAEALAKLKKDMDRGLQKIAKNQQQELEALLGRLETKYRIGLSVAAFDLGWLPLNLTLGDSKHNVPLDNWGSGTCRIPDDYIDENRYPLFMARAVLRELIESLQATGSATPC